MGQPILYALGTIVLQILIFLAVSHMRMPQIRIRLQPHRFVSTGWAAHLFIKGSEVVLAVNVESLKLTSLVQARRSTMFALGKFGTTVVLQAFTVRSIMLFLAVSHMRTPQIRIRPRPHRFAKPRGGLTAQLSEFKATQVINVDTLRLK
jgi:hypothetical protein